MDEQVTKKLRIVAIIESGEFARLCKAVKAVIAAFAEKATDLGTVGCQCAEDLRDPFADLLQAMREMTGSIDTDKLQELAELAADMPPFIHKKLPRPPKRTGPVNKANYTANRPPRVARSTCRKIRR